MVTNKKKYLTGETIFKILGNGLTIATLIVGIIQYKKTQIYNAKMEFLSMDNKRQVEAYTSLCNSLGKTVAASDDSATYVKQFKEFISIYYGDIILIEDSTIENMIKDLRFYLEDFNYQDEDRNQLKLKIKELADSCRVSIERKRIALIKEITQ